MPDEEEKYHCSDCDTDFDTRDALLGHYCSALAHVGGGA